MVGGGSSPVGEEKAEPVLSANLMALPKKARLAKNKDFLRVFQRSQRAESKNVLVRVHWKPAPPARIAVVVSNKVSKKAFLRNAMRRRIVEWLRQSTEVIAKPVDIVITAKPGAASFPKTELLGELQQILRRLRLL